MGCRFQNLFQVTRLWLICSKAATVFRITISFMIPELAGQPFIKVPNPIESYKLPYISCIPPTIQCSSRRLFKFTGMGMVSSTDRFLLSITIFAKISDENKKDFCSFSRSAFMYSAICLNRSISGAVDTVPTWLSIRCRTLPDSRTLSTIWILVFPLDYIFVLTNI